MSFLDGGGGGREGKGRAGGARRKGAGKYVLRIYHTLEHGLIDRLTGCVFKFILRAAGVFPWQYPLRLVSTLTIVLVGTLPATW